jgi:hypothetical protein
MSLATDFLDQGRRWFALPPGSRDPEPEPATGGQFQS